MISICIVTLNARIYLKRCLESIPDALSSLRYEVIVIDNGSIDGTSELIKKKYPNINYIKNKKNLGYTIPMNRAISMAKGEYVLQLNPDIELSKKSIYLLVNYMNMNKKIGICIPKIIDENGNFEKSSRRGIPTPWATVTYFSGLSRMFSDNRKFTQYRLEHLNEDAISEVDAVSGSCMLIKSNVIDDIGILDEKFFAYQEDSDFCFRAKQANWKIVYNPQSTITHFTGRGGSKSYPMKTILEWHRSYYYYFNKHLSKNYSKLFNFFYIIIMMTKMASTTFLYFLKK